MCWIQLNLSSGAPQEDPKLRPSSAWLRQPQQAELQQDAEQFLITEGISSTRPATAPYLTGHSTPYTACSGDAAQSWCKAHRAESLLSTAREKGNTSAFGSTQRVSLRAANSHPTAPHACWMPRYGLGLPEPSFYDPGDRLQPDCFPRQGPLGEREWKILQEGFSCVAHFHILACNCIQFVFYGHLLLIWSERRRGDYFWVVFFKGFQRLLRASRLKTNLNKNSSWLSTF